MSPEMAWMVGIFRTGWKTRFELWPAAIPVVPNGVEALIWPFFLALRASLINAELKFT
jgi:hypothetical protein